MFLKPDCTTLKQETVVLLPANSDQQAAETQPTIDNRLYKTERHCSAACSLSFACSCLQASSKLLMLLLLFQVACLVATEILALVGLRSFRTATLLLVGLLAYDVFWVFGSPAGRVQVAWL
jgi:hypothetical protein